MAKMWLERERLSYGEPALDYKHGNLVELCVYLVEDTSARNSRSCGLPSGGLKARLKPKTGPGGVCRYCKEGSE